MVAPTIKTPAMAMAMAALLSTLAGGACSPGPLDVGGLAPSSLEMGLVAHWSFDEEAGPTVFDRSGNGQHGTLARGTRIAGRFARALHFDDQAEVVVQPFAQATANWTVAAWVRLPASTVAPDFISFLSTENVFAGGWEMNVMLRPDNTYYHFGYWIGPDMYTYASVNCACVERDRWTHLAAIVDADHATLSFYRDGVLSAQSAITRGISEGSATLLMGHWNMNGRFLIGDLDDVAIYRRALAAEEVAALSTAPAPDPH